MSRDNRPSTREEQQEKQTIRKRRVPLGRHRMRLKIDPKLLPDNMVARWINDDGQRLQEAMDAGYQFVNDPEMRVGEGAQEGRDKMSGYVRTLVGEDRQNNPMYGYLMMIEKELYEADQKEKQHEINLIEKSLKRGTDKEGQVGRDGRYIPKEGITIETKQ